MTRFQVIPEERFMHEKFGESYSKYPFEVRRGMVGPVLNEKIIQPRRTAMNVRLRFFMAMVSIFSCALLSSSALAWEVPDKVWVSRSMPPVYWQKSGSIQNSGNHFLQRYELFKAGGTPKNTFRIAVIWPVKDKKFCVEVLPLDTQPSDLPSSCNLPVPDHWVKMEVTSPLYDQNSLKE